eukprot:2617041-Ditylum_brightwellii.AAC.2
MGGSSSPGKAGQEMAAIAEELEKHPLLKGRVKFNLVTSHYTGTNFDPSLPEGQFEVNPDGYPVPLVWIYVDDFLIHAATHHLYCEAVSVMMDTLLCMDLLAHQSKVKCQAQFQQCCGFVYNIESIPQVQVPTDKQDNSLALLAYLNTWPQPLFHLALAVVIGHLQSLVPVMPGNTGATCLRYLYDVLHEDDGSGLSSADLVYY